MYADDENELVMEKRTRSSNLKDNQFLQS